MQKKDYHTFKKTTSIQNDYYVKLVNSFENQKESVDLSNLQNTLFVALEYLLFRLQDQFLVPIFQ